MRQLVPMLLIVVGCSSVAPLWQDEKGRQTLIERQVALAQWQASAGDLGGAIATWQVVALLDPSGPAEQQLASLNRQRRAAIDGLQESTGAAGAHRSALLGALLLDGDQGPVRRKLQALEIDNRVPNLTFPDARSSPEKPQSAPPPSLRMLDPGVAEAFQTAVATEDFEVAYELFQAHADQLRESVGEAPAVPLDDALHALASAFNDAARREEQRDLRRAVLLLRRSLEVVPQQPGVRTNLTRVQSMLDNLQRIRAYTSEKTP